MEETIDRLQRSFLKNKKRLEVPVSDKLQYRVKVELHDWSFGESESLSCGIDGISSTKWAVPSRSTSKKNWSINLICFLQSLSVTHEKISASVLILQPSNHQRHRTLANCCQSIDCVPRSHSSGDEHNRSPEEDPPAVWETQQALSWLFSYWWTFKTLFLPFQTHSDSSLRKCNLNHWHKTFKK